jgi:hypothetical protein
MNTLELLIDRHGVDVHDHLDRAEIVPVHAGLQIQGDVAVIPVVGKYKATPVPAAGVPVVRGENGGNTHLLLADGDVGWTSDGANALVLGWLTVADGATAWLAHPEHGYLGVAPGVYELRRQREQADEIRMVAD